MRLLGRLREQLAGAGKAPASSPADTAAGYADIGGLDKVVARVREMVELPLRRPELFRELGVEPPKGVLLHGPPGSGKTLIARAVAHEAGCHFIAVNGPEIIRQHYGESEALLRGVFAEARAHAPAIIFLDEIDALAPARGAVLGEVEKRVVAQLLALMDGVAGRGQLVVIAATNLPNAIDPALRRPGRFDREITIAPPDAQGRLAILRIHTRSMPLADSVDLARLAAETHGFLGADLAALCREAAMACARDIGPGPARIEMRHFEAARGEIDLSTTREVFSETPGITWSDVGGLEPVKQVLRETVEWPLRYAARFAHLGIAPPRGVLLTGGPGTGKTLVAQAIAAESGVNFIAVRGPELVSKWVGDSERGIREVFRKARQAAPAILFFDEIDAMLPARGRGGDSTLAERLVGQFLVEMDGIEGLQGVTVIAATSRPDLIDPALLRPGRFERVVELPLPDEAARHTILAIQSRGLRLTDDVSLADLAGLTQGRTGADLAALCRAAATSAIARSVARQGGDAFDPFGVTAADFAAALGLFGLQSTPG